MYSQVPQIILCSLRTVPVIADSGLSLVTKIVKTKNAWEFHQKEDIDQLWAEAYYYWSEGESLVLEGELEEEALRIQLSHTEGGELVGLIEEYLDIVITGELGVA